MSPNAFRLTTADGLGLHVHDWPAPGPARGSVIISHGLGEHGGRYAQVAARLGALGFAVHALDHRGHGLSDGPRALIPSYEAVVDDLDRLIERERRAAPERPLFLLGHSMGGALALAYARRHQAKLSGLVLSGPAVIVEGATPLLEWLVGRIAALVPRLPVFRVDARLVSRDAEEVARYVGDPLNRHGGVPARTLVELVRFTHDVLAWAPTLTLPVLIQHGGDDRLTPAEGSRRLAAAIGSADCTLDVHAGLYHEIYNERPADRERVLDTLCGWLAVRCPGAGTAAPR